VHRTPRSRWSKWWPFLLVLVVFPALAYGIVTVLSDWDGLPGGGDAAPAADGTTEPTSDGTTAPTETAVPEVPPPTEAPPVEAPPADLSRPVDVSNSTETEGLAGNGRDRLEAAGFTQVKTSNWAGDNPAASVVYYGVATDITTAQQVATTLGLAPTAVSESADLAPDGIVAVLASDYAAT
jgi:hypothetical protein